MFSKAQKLNSSLAKFSPKYENLRKRYPRRDIEVVITRRSWKLLVFIVAISRKPLILLSFWGVPLLFARSVSRSFLAIFSHLSRNFLQFLAIFLQYPKRFEPIFKGTKDYSGQFNNLRRHIEAVITRLSWKQFGSESPRGFESLCLRQSLGALCSKAFFYKLMVRFPCSCLGNYNIPQKIL